MGAIHPLASQGMRAFNDCPILSRTSAALDESTFPVEDQPAGVPSSFKRSISSLVFTRTCVPPITRSTRTVYLTRVCKYCFLGDPLIWYSMYLSRDWPRTQSVSSVRLVSFFI